MSEHTAGPASVREAAEEVRAAVHRRLEQPEPGSDAFVEYLEPESDGLSGVIIVTTSGERGNEVETDRHRVRAPSHQQNLTA